MTKLSARAWEVLLAIDERCPGAYPEESVYWVPGELRGKSDRCERLGRRVNINGAGDARIITSLANKGLLKMKPVLGPYACQITEDGRLLVEQAIEQGKIPLQLI